MIFEHEILRSHLFGQKAGSSWARAFTGRSCCGRGRLTERAVPFSSETFHAILMWWVLCFPDCQLPLVGVIRFCLSVLLGIERLTSSWFLVLTSVCRPSALCPVCRPSPECAVSRYWHRQNLLWLLLFMENRKPSGAYLQCNHVWFLFTSWWIKTVCRVGSRGPWNKRLQCCCQFGMAQKQSD